MQALKVGFEADVDGDGIADGLAVAQALINYAHRMVAFYTDGCPGCTQKVLGAMTDSAMRHLPMENGRFVETRVVRAAPPEPGIDPDIGYERHRQQIRAKLDHVLVSATGRAPCASCHHKQ